MVKHLFFFGSVDVLIEKNKIGNSSKSKIRKVTQLRINMKNFTHIDKTFLILIIILNQIMNL